jgi:hypothetical protein
MEENTAAYREDERVDGREERTSADKIPAR